MPRSLRPASLHRVARRLGAVLGAALLCGLGACSDDPDAAPKDAAALDAGPDATPDATRDLGVGDARPEDVGAQDAGPEDALAPDLGPPGGERPAQVFPAEGPGPHPILLVLHGYQVNANIMLNNFPFHRSAPARGVIVVAPDGTRDESNARFWDAEHCCPERDVDDVGYLLDLVSEVATRYDGDPAQVYVFGHSNGGYMAHHLACVAADRIAGIFSVSGLAYPRDRCTPARPVGMWQIHGTDDASVPYAGSETQPGVEALATWWAAHNGCADRTEPAEMLDLIDLTEGAETERVRYADCPASAPVERWRMEAVGHLVFPNADFFERVLTAIAPPR